MKKLNLMSLALLFAIGGLLSACDVEQTEQARLPEADVEIEDTGNLPEYDVDTPEVEMDTETVEVQVPDVDLQTDNEIVEDRS